jgi:hypothetical protein
MDKMSKQKPNQLGWNPFPVTANHKQTSGQTNRQVNKWMNSHTVGKQAHRQTNAQFNTQTHKHVHTYTLTTHTHLHTPNKQTTNKKKTDKQTDKETNKQTQEQTNHQPAGWAHKKKQRLNSKPNPHNHLNATKQNLAVMTESKKWLAHLYTMASPMNRCDQNAKNKNKQPLQELVCISCCKSILIENHHHWIEKSEKQLGHMSNSDRQTSGSCN